MQTAQNGDAWRTWEKGSSPLNGPLLALLRDRPSHPYDFASQIGLLMGVSSDLSTVYRMLERFEQIGLAVSHKADSNKTGQRITMYEATELTPKAAAQWMQSPLPSIPIREPIAIRIAVSRPEDTPYLLRALNQHEKRCFELLAKTKSKHPVVSWQDMEIELTREGLNGRIKAELDWIDLARGYIGGFQDGRYIGAPVEQEDSDILKRWLKGSSPLKGPLLALLNVSPSHPNKLAALLNHRLGASWTTDLTTVGRILDRFEQLGLAASRKAESNGQRVKVYAATELTSKAVAQWMQSPLPDIPTREPIVVRIAVSRPEDAPYLLQALEQDQRTQFALLAEHRKKHSTATWKSMEKELTRKGVNLRIDAELKWIDLALGYIANFQGARGVSVVV